MEILDPFIQPLPLPSISPPCSGVGGTDMTIEFAQLDDYFRASGVFPPLPPTQGYTSTAATVHGAMDRNHVEPAAPLPTHSASSYIDGAAAVLSTYDRDIDANL
ncbi:putative cyclin-F2-1 [Panicum miliaceum]|uniref:Cyclin-F2-1 n=1 Tax=Panicum miliaceum TaxID=4540 RepID=A0A3L6SUG2_PANMI|nr:putative cyclin-F2-1 [Panicum miliaceum]